MLDDLRLALSLILHSLAQALEPADEPADEPGLDLAATFPGWRVVHTANPDEPEFLRWQ